MIRKILLMSVIIFGGIFIWGCDGDTSHVSENPTDVEQVSTTSKEKQTEDDETEEITEPSADEVVTHPSASSEPLYAQFEDKTILKVYEFMRATVGINIRKGPSEEYARLDGVAKDEVLNVIGQCVETGWYMIKKGNIIGFVSNRFVAKADDLCNLILGDECPYDIYVKTEYNGQAGWFYCSEKGWRPVDYESILNELTEAGYTVENFPVYVGTWRDVGNVMWLGYSKK